MNQRSLELIHCYLEEIKTISSALKKFEDLKSTKRMYIHYQAAEIGNTHYLMTIDDGCKDLIINYHKELIEKKKKAILELDPTFIFDD